MAQHGTAALPVAIATPIEGTVPVAVAVPMVQAAVPSSDNPEFMRMLMEGGTWHGKATVSGVILECTATKAAGSLTTTSDFKVTVCGCCPVFSGVGTMQFSPDGQSYTSTSNFRTTTGTLQSVDVAAQCITYAFRGIEDGRPTLGTMTIDGRAKTMTIAQTVPKHFVLVMSKD